MEKLEARALAKKMIIRTGVDLIEIDRIAEVVSRHGKRYLERVYTPEELSLCGKRKESLAGRFAAKEAVAKALGCGIGEVAWKEIEILEDERKSPVIRLHGEADRMAHQLGLQTWSLSITHNQSQAIAFVVVLG